MSVEYLHYGYHLTSLSYVAEYVEGCIILRFIPTPFYIIMPNTYTRAVISSLIQRVWISTNFTCKSCYAAYNYGAATLKHNATRLREINVIEGKLHANTQDASGISLHCTLIHAF